MTTKRHTIKPEQAEEEVQEEALEPSWHTVAEADVCHIDKRRRQVDMAELNPKQLQRVLKNRQSAQSSRDRHKAYVAQLEAARDKLTEEASDLRVRVNVLETEKKSLSNEVTQLKTEFEELRALLVRRLSGPSAEQLVHEPQPTPVEALDGGDKARMALRPADQLATPLSLPSSLPSIKLVDQHTHLGGGKSINKPLPARLHCARRPHHQLPSPSARRFLVSCVAPLTLRLLEARKRKQAGSSTLTSRPLHHRLRGSKTSTSGAGMNSRRFTRKTKPSSLHTSTWKARQTKLSKLMHFLISKYQPKP